MDFMKWLNSLDEFLYEVMSWVLFFPLTLWKAVFHPIRVMAEIEREAGLPEDQQYQSLLSPPLFLALTLLIGHSVATALGQSDNIIANHHGLADLVDDNTSALVLRVIVFASFPLFLAARMVRCRGAKLDRASLQQPFYQQCYPAAVFALGISVGSSLSLDDHPPTHTAGHCIVALSVIYFCVVETRWLAHALGVSRWRAAGNVFLGMLEGALFLLGVGYLFTR